jgi:hypothetical protein
VAIIFTLFFLLSCDDMEDKEHKSNVVTETSVTGIYILSEGLFNLNNSTLAYYNFGEQTLNSDLFLSANGRGLGDTANDMRIYGSKLYIVVNVSSQLEVVDLATGRSIKQIPFFDDAGVARQPRYIDFDGSNAYVSSFDGTLTRIDTTSLNITGMVRCGRNPDRLCITNGKIYVSNSGGLDYPNYDNTVSVVDIASFTEKKKITVAINPGKIEADSEGDVYVVSRGNYADATYKFQRIDSKTDQLVQTFDRISAQNFTISHDTAYICDFNANTQTAALKVFDCKKEEIISDNFITDGTLLTTPYGLDVNPVNGDLYVSDAKSYTVWGDMLCFSRSGKLKFKLQEVGLNPNKTVFVARSITTILEQ